MSAPALGIHHHRQVPGSETEPDPAATRLHQLVYRASIETFSVEKE